MQASTSSKPGKLSQILTNASAGGELMSVALKSLPVDPARSTQWQTGGGGAGAGVGAKTCKEAVEGMVVEVKSVCEDAGVVDDNEGFITEEDIVR